MTQQIPYLVFPGNCKEAMPFYASVFGGKVTMMQTFGESPIPVPDGLEGRIFNSEIKANGIHLRASDDLPGHEVTPGTNISLQVIFDEEENKRNAFEALSEGGKVLFPITDNFGMLRDRFGIQWMLEHKV